MNSRTRRLIVTFSVMLISSIAIADTALVKDADVVIYRASRNTLKEARLAAMAYCKKESKVGKCKPLGESKANTSGYGAVSQSDSETHTITGYATAFDTEDEAKESATQICEKKTAKQNSCSIILTFHDDAHSAALSRATAKAPAVSENCSPPTGKVVRSNTVCDNGDCTRTFENGCAIRFQAAYCHNPFNGQWEWKPDGC